jgi:hypothetical protein
VGQAREAHILEAKPRNSAHWFVSPAFASLLSCPELGLIERFHRQLETQQHKPALALIETLLTELRRLDDKMILTEVHLLESRVYRGVGNLAKAKVRAFRVTSLTILTSLFNSPP